MDLQEEQEAVEDKLLVTDDVRHGLVDISGKGRGVQASRPISKGNFVVKYAGELMDAGSGHAMEATYSMDMTKGSYSYYFPFNSLKFCLDATEESGRFGHLLNHSHKQPTCVHRWWSCWHTRRSDWIMETGPKRVWQPVPWWP